MQNSARTFFFAKTIPELFYQLKSVAGLQAAGSCTRLDDNVNKVISIRGIPDLAVISKHERYLDCGPGVTLSRIIELARARVPEIFLEAIWSIANPFVRNIATIGGSICARGIKSTVYAPLLALDTRLEFRSQTNTTYVPLVNFTEIPYGAILSNIRIPLSEWDIAVFRRFGPQHIITDTSASFAFLADTEKNAITNIKLAFSGPISLRCLEFENRLIGTRLPLSLKDIAMRVEIAAKQFDKVAESQNCNLMLREQFINLTRYSLEQLA